MKISGRISCHHHQNPPKNDGDIGQEKDYNKIESNLPHNSDSETRNRIAQA